MQCDELESRIQLNAGKVILIKLNLTGISQYFMNWFIIPTYICKEIDRTIETFFGIIIKIDTQGTERTRQMIGCDKIYRTKCEDGLEVKKI